jgi:response regulator NasT
MARSLRSFVDMTAYSEYAPATWNDSALSCQRVLLAGPGDVTQRLAAALDPHRYSTTARFESLAYLAEGVQACEPDAVVVVLGNRARDDIEISAAVASAQPTVVWSESDDRRVIERAMAGGAAAYVLGEAPSERINHILLVARLRFEQLRGLRDELAQLRQTLADRKVIDRAKGLLMQQRKLTEDEAYHLMRRIAMNHGRRVVEVANAILMSPSALQTV